MPAAQQQHHHEEWTYSSKYS